MVTPTFNKTFPDHDEFVIKTNDFVEKRQIYYSSNHCVQYWTTVMFISLSAFTIVYILIEVCSKPPKLILGSGHYTIKNKASSNLYKAPVYRNA